MTENTEDQVPEAPAHEMTTEEAAAQYGATRSRC